MQPDLAIHAAALEPPGETRMMRVVMPEMLNHHGTMFGVQALGMMDVTGFVAATRLGGQAPGIARSRPGDMFVGVARREFEFGFEAGLAFDLPAREGTTAVHEAKVGRVDPLITIAR